ncbi:MAG: hypothetical protein ACKOYJ_06510, partial [Planctomycetia bacterium]
MASEHRPLFLLTHAALGIVACVCLAGCKTPPPAPVYGATTVPPPATGMVGQPAPYGAPAMAPQQAVAYPPAQTAPMPGPATSWQGVQQPAAAPA